MSFIPDIEIKAAAEIDVGKEAENWAKRAALREWNTPRVLRPVFSTGLGSLNYVATVINDSPQSRRKWTIRRVSVGQQLALGTGLAAASGVAFFLYRYTQATFNPNVDLNNLNSADIVWQGSLYNSTSAGIPLVLWNTIGNNEATLFHPEKALFVAFGYGTANINSIPFSGQLQVIDAPVYAEELFTHDYYRKQGS